MPNFDYQKTYFKTKRPPTMLAQDTPYVRRHFNEVMGVAGDLSGKRICEWGAGLGRFSRLLAQHVSFIDAIELSPTQAEECRQHTAECGNVDVIVGDIIDVLSETDVVYDAIVGFFMLHHLERLDQYFRRARESLSDKGVAVFVEPNPFNPLYPLQISLTPGMKWAAEKGIYSLWPRSTISALTEAGFSDVKVTRYGALPRGIYNKLAEFGQERSLESLTPDLLKPFQIIKAAV